MQEIKNGIDRTHLRVFIKIKPGLYGLEKYRNKTKKEELFLKQKRTKTPKYRDRSITLTIKAYW